MHSHALCWGRTGGLPWADCPEPFVVYTVFIPFGKAWVFTSSFWWFCPTHFHAFPMHYPWSIHEASVKHPWGWVILVRKSGWLSILPLWQGVRVRLSLRLRGAVLNWLYRLLHKSWYHYTKNSGIVKGRNTLIIEKWEEEMSSCKAVMGSRTVLTVWILQGSLCILRFPVF